MKHRSGRPKLPITKLAEFQAFCQGRGWATTPTKGEYEVLRMTHPDKVGALIVHRRMDDRDNLTLHGHSQVEFDEFAGLTPAQRPSNWQSGPSKRPARTPADTAPWE